MSDGEGWTNYMTMITHQASKNGGHSEGNPSLSILDRRLETAAGGLVKDRRYHSAQCLCMARVEIASRGEGACVCQKAFVEPSCGTRLNARSAAPRMRKPKESKGRSTNAASEKAPELESIAMSAAVRSYRTGAKVVSLAGTVVESGYGGVLATPEAKVPGLWTEL
ncbi:hypothetical protein OBBRIDRAFT_802065 [Obba rivulosa]|uniref:Uncharacterized protein n=1 Tax=Obba rivulosa TaxID=1052685 RepID=A0A8E2AZ15_9APHY|nr:hypothetical protein OBBRIDRAFT_802065 [Obba rivulosa]